MDTKRSNILIGLCLLAPVFFFALSFSDRIHAASSEYPERPISLVVPFPAGGLTDIGARFIAEGLERHLKQTVVVVNKVGGGGTIGGYAVGSAKPDGYTLGFFAAMSSMPEVFSYFFMAPYTSEALRPVSRMQTAVLGWTVKGDSPWNSLKDIVDYARANPGIKLGHPGKATIAYVSIVTVAKAEKVNLIDLPFEGDAKIVPAVLGGIIPVGVTGFAPVRSLYDAKKVKVLAMCLDKRAEFAPEIPTIVDLGYNLINYAFLGVFCPKGTPDSVVKKIDEALYKVSEENDFRKKSNDAGLQVVFENTASFEKSIVKTKGDLHTFFKGEGLVK